MAGKPMVTTDSRRLDHRKAVNHRSGRKWFGMVQAGSVTTHALPLSLRVFADLLRQYGGRQLGRAVLFASVVGFDVVERRINDLATASGVSVDRLQQIVDTGRQALGTASPKVRDQHVVSQAVLRRFYGPASQGDRLLSYNLQYGTARPRSTEAVGKIENFVKIDSAKTEQLWSRTEQNLPAAIDAVRTRRIFQHLEHVATIKDAIALHYARSLDVLDSADQIWKQGLDQTRTAFLANQTMAEHLFYLKHGFYASGPAVAEEIANDLIKDATALYQSGAAFRLRVVDVFEEAKRMAAPARLEIICPSVVSSSSATCPPFPLTPFVRSLVFVEVCRLVVPRR
jgi:hypothetical protein